MIRKFTFITLFLSFLLSSCSYLPKVTGTSKRDSEYLSAQSSPPLKIPAGLKSQSFENHYPIPDRNYDNNGKDVSILPPDLQN